ncbi:MAG: amino acid ABC transporter permease [Vicinamibacterales bacterium]
MPRNVIIANLPYLLNGLKTTVVMSLTAMALCLVFGTVLCAARRSRWRLLNLLALLYIDVLRSAPLLLIIFWFIFFLPRFTGISVEPYNAGMIALVAYFSTHVAEIMRAGIQAVPRTQTEAGLGTGLSRWRVYRYVVMPQAIKNIIPALISRFVALVMGTSLTYIVGVIEFFRAATIVNNREYASIQIYAFVAMVYFVICFGFSQFGEWCRRRLGAQELRGVEASLGR